MLSVELMCYNKLYIAICSHVVTAKNNIRITLSQRHTQTNTYVAILCHIVITYIPLKPYFKDIYCVIYLISHSE